MNPAPSCTVMGSSERADMEPDPDPELELELPLLLVVMPLPLPLPLPSFSGFEFTAVPSLESLLPSLSLILVGRARVELIRVIRRRRRMQRIGDECRIRRRGSFMAGDGDQDWPNVPETWRVGRDQNCPNVDFEACGDDECSGVVVLRKVAKTSVDESGLPPLPPPDPPQTHNSIQLSGVALSRRKGSRTRCDEKLLGRRQSKPAAVRE